MSFNELCNDFNINQRQSERILNIINNYFITKLNDDSTTSDVYEDEILAILGQSNNIDYHICQYILLLQIL